MLFSWFKKIFPFLFLLVGTLHADKGYLYSRDFWKPMFHGQALNYCALKSDACGRAIATRYCQEMGYTKAQKQIIAYHVGLTHFIDDNHARCKGWQCNGFKTIRCVSTLSHKPPKDYHYRSRHYVLPRFNHYRLDWCKTGEKQCGRPAAQSFCRQMGYSSTQGFAIQKHLGATQAIGNQKLCFGMQCNGFAYVNCFR